MEPETDLERLGRLVVARRRVRGWPTREEFSSNVDLSYRVLTDLENGKRRLGAKAYSAIETALHWTPGSVDAVLEGRDPQPIDTGGQSSRLLAVLRARDKPPSEQTPEERAAIWKTATRAEATRRAEEFSQRVSRYLQLVDLADEAVDMLSTGDLELLEGTLEGMSSEVRKLAESDVGADALRVESEHRQRMRALVLAHRAGDDARIESILNDARPDDATQPGQMLYAARRFETPSPGETLHDRLEGMGEESQVGPDDD
ncbi:hypothetical protein L5G28_07455 [Gordonia sp. HY285]|uniref:hypothetical protein n=1 Tax=Gordonia liuliyuniae TaxID=2911517 RepID=UPI001F28D6F6|nr:hypothetical protein [Gordonia liuliyuniae]MCF8609996.1 hypothetical protein [Gordonia liuliyuniae]